MHHKHIATDAPEPSAARTYRELHDRRVCELLDQWVSGVDPIRFIRVDVSPQILAEIGIGAPQLVAQVTVADMIAAGAIG